MHILSLPRINITSGSKYLISLLDMNQDLPTGKQDEYDLLTKISTWLLAQDANKPSACT